MNKNNEQIKRAYDLGYRVVNGDVISPYSKKVRKLRLTKCSGNYEKYTFNIRASTGEAYPIDVHRLMAYQKYGSESFNPLLEVRHLDSNSLNNFEDNIFLGTTVENAMDKPPEERKQQAIKASETTRKYSDFIVAEIRAYYAENKSYIKTMKKFNISSKGTLYYILHNDYQTKK